MVGSPVKIEIIDHKTMHDAIKHIAHGTANDQRISNIVPLITRRKTTHPVSEHTGDHKGNTRK
ncbi:Uncharacterised protein [Vibrio cholerae]|nr:Uncharacterised protein [Vibrio cholerae]CSI16234.1 Uncharacterised protein [Vibrio cholerae]